MREIWILLAATILCMVNIAVFGAFWIAYFVEKQQPLEIEAGSFWLQMVWVVITGSIPLVLWIKALKAELDKKKR